MPQKGKAKDYPHLLAFYRPGDAQPPSEENGWQITQGEPVLFKRIWCRTEAVFREQLEAHVNGITINRKRVRLYMRLREDLDSTMTFVYRGQTYHVAIYGELKGETQVLGEVPEDGGA